MELLLPALQMSQSRRLAQEGTGGLPKMKDSGYSSNNTVPRTGTPLQRSFKEDRVLISLSLSRFVDG